MSKKVRLGIVFGGQSGEHEISLRSAQSVMAAIDRSKYEIVPIAITKSGTWLSSERALTLADPDEQITETFKSGVPIVFSPRETGELLLDVVFPLLHGPMGEDGTVQGFLEMVGLPYVGAGVLGSAVGMDKDLMKRIIASAGLPTVEYWSLRVSQIEDFAKKRSKDLPYPVFVKPANLGSSVGITKVYSPEGLQDALLVAGEHDRKLIVEQGVEAREIEVSVIGNEDPIASVPGEIRPSGEFYDYQSKYVDDSELIIPAPLTEEQRNESRRLAVETYKVLECAGMGRVDLFLESNTERFFVNELNTIPGFTSISMYPRLWEASGISYQELIDNLIDLAFQRGKGHS